MVRSEPPRSRRQRRRHRSAPGGSRHGLLRRAGPGRTADTPYPSCAGGRDGDAEPAGARPRAPGHRHRQHGDAHDGPATTSTCACWPPCCAARRWTTAITTAFVPSGLDPKIPLCVSGFGPRAMELAGKHGDGLVFAIPPRGVAVADALGHARQGAARAGRALDGFRSCALTNVALLEPGEPVDSPRVVRTVGPNVMASVYYFYDEVQERGIEPPEFLRPIWKRYCALVEDTPAEYRHFRTHEFHYTY